METHSSILAWKIPWTEEPSGLQSVGLHRVRRDWSDLACTQARTHWPYWGSSCGKELWVVSRSWLWSQEAEDCYQQTASKKPGPSVLQLQGMNSAKNLSETGNESFSRWECSLTNTLIATLWDSKQKTQWNPDPKQLWNNK